MSNNLPDQKHTLIRKVLSQLFRGKSDALGARRNTVRHLQMILLRVVEGVQHHPEANRPIEKLDGIQKIGRPCGIWLLPLLNLEMVLLRTHRSRQRLGTVQVNLDLGELVENLNSLHPT